MAGDPLGRVCGGQAGGGRGGGDPPHNVVCVCVPGLGVAWFSVASRDGQCAPHPLCSPLGAALSAAVLGPEDRVGGRER